ncbi:T9SS type A sorting domain-containing protein [Telluribacter sp. SYSU D00476]|uniref:T9SS type A sorting domain-containing protein n=1 Tax=Telluribacter sp. SYSU D00476 TaxID=2811430 RepID=UPI001FF53E9B|nr:T9SS type A sorting domain-containing protein [Telluribacter sp. SYSU D00476]
MNRAVLRICVIGIITLGLVAESQAQRFFSVVFDKLPRDFQLYARNDQNEAVVPVSGVMELPNWSHMSLVVYRNNERISYHRSNLTYAAGSTSARFAMETKIKAEMADYSFEVYASQNGTDSVRIVRRDDVVAGDFYVINGQSNALAVGGSNASSKYWRTVGRVPDDNPGYFEGDTLWRLAAWSWPTVGQWGLELQKRILEEHQIPTCVINGSLPGTRLDRHLETNPEAVYTIHDLLRTRIRASGATRIRAFFWLQGEDDALTNPNGYEEKFDILHKMWQRDFPMVENFVVMQINILFHPDYNAGRLRDFQRRTPTLFPRTLHFTTIGLPFYDGIHYDRGGYQELGRQLANFISPIVYGAPNDPNWRSPNIQKAYYSSPERNEITLLFDEGQEMRWPADTVVKDRNGIDVTMSARTLFYFDGNESAPAPIASAQAQGNRLVLKLASPANAQRINYLPAFNYGTRFSVFPGPFIKNKNGVSAFSFHEVAIGAPLAVRDFKKDVLAVGSESSIKLSWQPVSGTDIQYMLERKKEGENNFSPVTQFDGKAATFTDTGLEPNTAYTYRLRAVSPVSESPAVELTTKTDPILALTPSYERYWIIYPNPTRDFINITFGQPVTGTLQLFDLSGRPHSTQSLKHEMQTVLDVTRVSTGVYVLSFENEKGEKTSNQVVIK